MRSRTSEAFEPHQLHHDMAEAAARYIEGQRLWRYREWLRARGASQPAGKGQEVAPLTQKELEVLEKYDNGELLKERYASIVDIGGNTGGNTGGGSRRVVDSWKPPDWRELVEDPE